MSCLVVSPASLLLLFPAVPLSCILLAFYSFPEFFGLLFFVWYTWSFQNVFSYLPCITAIWCVTHCQNTWCLHLLWQQQVGCKQDSIPLCEHEGCYKFATWNFCVKQHEREVSRMPTHIGRTFTVPVKLQTKVLCVFNK